MEKVTIMSKRNITNNIILKNIFIALLIIFISLSIYNIDLEFETKLKVMAWIGNVSLIWGLVIFYKIKGSNINPYSFYFVTYYIFSFGQIFLYSIGIKDYFYNLIYIYRNDEIISYCLYFLLGTCFFIIGALIAIRKDDNVDKIHKDNYGLQNPNNFTMTKAVKIIVITLTIISAPAYITDLVNNINLSINFGYGAIYENTSSGLIQNIFIELKNYFVPSMIFLMVIYKKNIIIRSFIIISFMLIIISQFVVGGRTESMALFLSLVFLWDSEIKKMKTNNKVIIFAFLFIIISLLPVIQDFRGTANKSLESFVELMFFQSENSLITQLISELGSSMEPWLMVNRLIPEYSGFRLGESYFSSFLTIIPSFLMGGISFAEKAALAQWLMRTLNMSYGPGFSIMAEAYYNFGWFGVPFLTLIGWLYYKMLSNNMFKGPIIKYKNVLSTITLYFFITSARSSLYLSIRREIYFVLLPIIAIYIVNNSLKRKNENNIRNNIKM